MFRSGDIVLYRLDVSQIKQIKQEKDRTFYLLYSLGSEYCEFKVPCDNAGGHLQSLPSKQTLEHYLDEIWYVLKYRVIPAFSIIKIS